VIFRHFSKWKRAEERVVANHFPELIIFLSRAGEKNSPAEGARVSPDWKKWLDEVELLPKDVMVGSGKRTT
jgi:hypothetical protein